MSEETKTRPDFATDEMFKFLDELRETGNTNMFGAGPYLRNDFPELTKDDSYKVLGYWIHTPKEKR